MRRPSRRAFALRNLFLAATDKPTGRWLRPGSSRAHSNSRHESQTGRNQDWSTRGNGGVPCGRSMRGVVLESLPVRRELCSPARRITEAVLLLTDAPRTPPGLHLSKKGLGRQAFGKNITKSTVRGDSLSSLGRLRKRDHVSTQQLALRTDGNTTTHHTTFVEERDRAAFP